MREELDLCFKHELILPTTWLQELSVACLQNADCDLNDLRFIDNSNDLLLESMKSEMSDITCVTGTFNSSLAPSDLGKSTTICKDNCVQKLKFGVENIRNALLPSTDRSYSLDHDRLIPTLLLLENRYAHWLPSQLPPSSI